jgi:hypothetical protein
MKITITAEDIQFHERDFREHYNRIEADFNCDVFRVRLPARPTTLSRHISITCSTHPTFVENGSSMSIRAGRGATTTRHAQLKIRGGSRVPHRKIPIAVC